MGPGVRRDDVESYASHSSPSIAHHLMNVRCNPAPDGGRQGTKKTNKVSNLA